MSDVAVSYSRHLVTLLPASSVDALLQRIAGVRRAAGIVEAFQLARSGDARVELEHDDVIVLVGLIDRWADEVLVVGLPPRVWALRCALGDALFAPSGSQRE